MFSAAHIDTLFGETNRGLQRSMLLLDEHAPSTSGAGGGPSPTAGVWAGGPVVEPHTDAVGAVQALRGLGKFRAFVGASAELASSLETEATTPSAAMARQRRKGAAFPVLRRTVAGMRVRQLWSRAAEADRLWWPLDDAAEASPGDADVGTGTGAEVAALLFAAALCADLRQRPAECLQLVRRWWARPSPADAALRQLTAIARAEDGVGLAATVMRRMTRRIGRALQRLCPPHPLSAAPLLVPGWAGFVAGDGDLVLRADFLLQPLSSVSRSLLALYLREEDAFTAACRQSLVYTSSTVAQLLTAPAAADGVDPRRTLAIVRAVYDALLLPLEEQFSGEAARPGMAAALYTELAAPFAQQHKPALLPLVDSTRMEAAVSLLHTVHYRLLLVVEAVGRAEVARESGGGAASAATRQKRNDSLLKQSQGKITVNLLSAIAEDRELVLEESGSRSTTGHVLHRLHDGTDEPGSAVVFLYVNNGSVFYRRDRSRTFSVAQSVEEIFKHFST